MIWLPPTQFSLLTQHTYHRLEESVYQIYILLLKYFFFQTLIKYSSCTTNCPINYSTLQFAFNSITHIDSPRTQKYTIPEPFLSLCDTFLPVVNDVLNYEWLQFWITFIKLNRDESLESNIQKTLTNHLPLR